MLLSFAMILVSGLLAGWICQKMRIPSLFGMIIAGILIGPYMGNLIDASVLEMSASLRRIALIIILIRAGLKLDFDDLKKVGRSAILMCFVPATLEIVGMILLAPRFLGLSVLESAILGSVIAAVSPAVVVPRMIKLIDEGYGVNESIPQMILAGTSVDDVYVIVVFTALTSLATGQSVSIMSFVNIPLSIVIGVIFGLVVGTILIRFFKQMKVRLVVQIALMMSLSFILNTFEDQFPFIPFASLIAIMCMGMAIKRSDSAQAKLLSVSYDQLWVVAEVFLFVLVGASVAINSLYRTGIAAIVLLCLVIIFRMIGVALCVMGTPLKAKERLFCMIAYTPKATVQAAIGGLPLAMGLACGDIVLTVSVISILLTAPLGALGIDLTYKRFLKHSPMSQ